MFKKLRDHLILINFGITSIVILIVFAVIYISFTRSAENRPPTFQSVTFSQDTGIEQVVIDSLNYEKQAAARNLLTTLIVSGVLIELVVVLVSYYLADEAIKPIREAYDAQKNFVANASHEIKTPLAAIQANLEAADIHGNKWISNVEKETEKLTKLNNSLLTMARTDLIGKATLREVKLRDLISKTVEEFTPRMKDIDFQSNIKPSSKINIAADDFVQILSILMDNAIKYSDKKITLSLVGHRLEVKNDGTVISPDNLRHVFDRFYQADKSADGVGLGLSIAKAIAERNGWELMAESGRNCTKFILKF